MSDTLSLAILILAILIEAVYAAGVCKHPAAHTCISDVCTRITVFNGCVSVEKNTTPH